MKCSSFGICACFNQTNCMHTLIMTSTVKFVIIVSHHVKLQWRIQDLTLGGAWTLKIIESVDGWSKSHYFCVFLAICLLKLCIKWIASEASEEKFEKNERFGHKKHRSAAVRGGGRRVRPPLDPLVNTFLLWIYNIDTKNV